MQQFQKNKKEGKTKEKPLKRLSFWKKFWMMRKRGSSYSRNILVFSIIWKVSLFLPKKNQFWLLVRFLSCEKHLLWTKSYFCHFLLKKTQKTPNSSNFRCTSTKKLTNRSALWIFLIQMVFYPFLQSKWSIFLIGEGHLNYLNKQPPKKLSLLDLIAFLQILSHNPSFPIVLLLLLWRLWQTMNADLKDNWLPQFVFFFFHTKKNSFLKFLTNFLTENLSTRWNNKKANLQSNWKICCQNSCEWC